MTDARRSFRIEGQGDYLQISPLRRAHPNATDYWDGNWVNCEVDLAVGRFRGKYIADLRTDELEQFRNGLGKAYQDLRGPAVFESMEEWVRIEATGDGRGQFTADCEVTDKPGMGARLTFRLSLDQSAIPPILVDLDAILDDFPVLGDPTD